MVVEFGPTVLTKVTAFGGANLEQAIPPQMPMTLSVACMILGIARQTARNTLSKHRTQFPPPAGYMPNGERILSPEDFRLLRVLHPTRPYPRKVSRTK